MTHFKARNLTALLLVLILLVSMFSTTALAAEDEYITDFEAESEIIIEEEPTEELPEAEESSEDTSGIDISFEDDVEAGTEDAGLSDGITSGSTTVEVTGTLKEILEKGMTVSSGSAAIYPQQPDNSDIQVEFED